MLFFCVVLIQKNTKCVKSVTTLCQRIPIFFFVSALIGVLTPKYYYFNQQPINSKTATTNRKRTGCLIAVHIDTNGHCCGITVRSFNGNGRCVSAPIHISFINDAPADR